MAQVLVRFGNTAPVLVTGDPLSKGEGERQRVSIDNGYAHDNAVTRFEVDGGVRLADAFVGLARVYESHHSDDPPEWVECENTALAQLLADHFTFDEHVCVVGRPEGWEGLEHDAASPEGSR